MIRALIEILITIAAVLLARTILTSIVKGLAKASSSSFQSQSGTGRPGAASGSQSSLGELHKDPVCGTYVTDSGAVQRAVGGRTFYYCSEACRDKHALAAK